MNVPRLLFRLLLGRRLPITSGSVTVPGIRGPIVVRRDEHGIAYIEAEGDEDAWFGLGFCQAQDRAFKLETLLRIARGTLSELVGPRAIPVDRLSRRVGFLRSAGPQLDALAPEVRSTFEAFTRGINAGLTYGTRRAAHEFILLRSSPTPYTAADVAAVGKLQSFGLASNWDIELARLHILNEDGPEALAAVDPAYPEWHPITTLPGSQAGPAADRLADDLKVFADTVGLGGASNNWAIAASRTASGRPILANDPHLPPILPSPWYLAHLQTPDWAVAGASFIGTPAFPAGHNGFAAWGPTLGLADNTDLFIEELGPDGASVREGNDFVACDVRREVIHVRGKEDVVEEVVLTPRGPIIGPALGDQVGAISLRGLWLDPLPVKGLLTAHRARSFDEFRHAFEEWPSMSLNMAYADERGTIGTQLVGQVPRRRKGWGTIPMPGWEPSVGWEEAFVPFDEMPYAVDPPSGFLATANNKPSPEADGTFLGVDWIDGYRAARILEVLETRRDWDLDGVEVLQTDLTSLPWRELRDIVLSTPAQGDDARQALTLLKDWDGILHAGSPAASVFQFFLADVIGRALKAKAPRTWKWALGKGASPVASNTFFTARRVGHLVRLLREQPQDWFSTPWEHVVEQALETAIRSLEASFGNDETRWGWGRVRGLTLRHPMGERRLLGSIFNLGPFPWGGDANTVGQAAPDPIDPAANPIVIASLRMVVDVGSWEQCRFALPGGQSGNPLSPHYDDLLASWLRGTGVPIAWSPEAVEKATTQTLRLMPKPQAPERA